MACQTGSAVIAQKSPMVVNPATWHMYQSIDKARNWNDAKEHCESMNGHLATITSQAEWDFIIYEFNYLHMTNTHHWVGGSDEISEGEWEWITGESWKISWWHSGQPDGTVSQNSLLIDSELNWHDYDSYSIFYFLCEWDAPYEFHATYDLPTGVIHIPMFLTGSGEIYWMDISISTEDIVDFGQYIGGEGQE